MPTCMYVHHMYVSFLWHPNEGVGSHEPGVRRLGATVWVPGPRASAKAASALNYGPSLQPLLSFQESGSPCPRLAPTHGDPHPPECWDLRTAVSQLSSLCCSSLLCGTKVQTQILSMPGRHSATKPHPQPRSFTSREFSP